MVAIDGTCRWIFFFALESLGAVALENFFMEMPLRIESLASGVPTASPTHLSVFKIPSFDNSRVKGKLQFSIE